MLYLPGEFLILKWRGRIVSVIEQLIMQAKKTIIVGTDIIAVAEAATVIK